MDNSLNCWGSGNEPKNITVMLSRQCNLSCSYCIEESKEDQSVLPYDILINQLSQLDHGSVVEFTGGEPLLHSNLIAQAFDWALEQRHEFCWVITTNGNVMPTRHFVENYLAQFQSIRISIDGPREYHDLHRGLGSFNRAMQFLTTLHEGGLRRISLNPTFTRLTMRHFFRTTKWFLNLQKQFKLPCLTLDLNIADRTDWVDADFSTYKSQLEQTLHWHEALPDSDKKYLSLACLKRARQPSSKFSGYFSVCPAGFNVFALSPRGKIVPCMTDLFKGDEHIHSSLRSFSSESEYQNLTMNRDYPDCFACDRYQCGPCPALFKMTTGDAKKIPRNYCRFGKITDAVINRFLAGLTGHVTHHLQERRALRWQLKNMC